MQTQSVTQKAEPTLVDSINTYAEAFGSDPNLVYSVGLCESHLSKKKGDSGRANGEWQYHKETWNRYASLYRKTYNVPDQFNIESSHDQAKLTAFVFSLGESSKREWTTYRAIKNGGTYTFYSKLLNQWFTVKCDLKKIPA